MQISIALPGAATIARPTAASAAPVARKTVVEPTPGSFRVADLSIPPGLTALPTAGSIHVELA